MQPNVNDKLDAMKRSRELTKEDLLEHPVWTFCKPSAGDEVQPHQKRGPVPLMALIRIRVVASDGAEYLGFALHTKLALVAPKIVTESGHVPLYLPDGEPTRAELEAAYERLNTTAEKFFPAKLVAEVNTRNESVWDTFEAFMYRDEKGVHAIA